MAVKYDQDTEGKKSGSPTPRTSLTNGTSARKYVAKDIVENYDLEDTRVRSNAEHMINNAAGLRATSLVADQAAEIARRRLSQVRSEIVGSSPKRDSDARTNQKIADSYDLTLEQRQVSQQISEAVGNDQQTKEKLDRVSVELVDRGVESFLSSYKSSLSSVANIAVPEIEHVRIEMDKKKGTVDCFFAQVSFVLSKRMISAGNIRAIRIFRAEILNPEFTRHVGRLSLFGVDRMRTDKNRTRSKTDDYTSNIEHRLREGGIDNAVTALTPIDSLRNARVGTSESRRTSVQPPAKITQAASGKVALEASSFLKNSENFIHLDKSVVNDLNSMRNIQLQNPDQIPGNPLPEGFVPGDRGMIHDQLGKEHLRQNREAHKVQTPLVVSQPNRQDFREIAFIAPDKFSREIIGDAVKYVFEDQTISYGRAYRYYVLTVDNNLRESVRSRIVEVCVDGLRIPDRPKSVVSHIIGNAISLTALVDDQLVEKFEIYRREMDLGVKLVQAKEIKHVSGKDGFTLQKSVVTRGSNGYMLIGETINGTCKSGATFYDRDIVRGRRYKYRVYSVDIFGNKSHMPGEVDVFVPDPMHRGVELDSPVILAEVDTATKKAKITFKCDDPRVTAVFLKRRDLTVHQPAFVDPSGVSSIKFGSAGSSQGQGRFGDVRFVDPEMRFSWTGYFSNIASGSYQTFIDKTTSSDRYYQYQIYGVDRFGNQSPFAFSKRIFTMNRPHINYPLNLSADISYGPGAIVQGVKLFWEDGNHDITSEERLGDREKLNRNSVKTLYQLERRKVGEQKWFEYPLTEQRDFFDPTEFGTTSAVNPVSPSFRPDFVEANERYEYRVSTLQSGGFFSNFSPPVEIFVNSPVKPPIDFRIKSADAKVRPFYVMLNWTTDASSAVVDRWEIQRLGVDSFVADRINTRNLSELASLNYQPFTTVFAESSRFSAKTSDTAAVRSNGKIVVPPREEFQPVLDQMLVTKGGAFGAGNVLNRYAEKNKQIIPPPPTAVRQGNGTIVGDHHFMDSTVMFGNTYFYRIRSCTPHGDFSDWVYRGVKVTETVNEIRKDVFLPATYVKDPPKINTVYFDVPTVLTPNKNTSLSYASMVNYSYGLSNALTKAWG